MAKGTHTTKVKLGRETKTITVRKNVKQRNRDAGYEPGLRVKKSIFSWLLGK